MKWLPENFDKNNKKHVSQLHTLLDFLGEKVPEESEDFKARMIGSKTSAALIKVKTQFKLSQTADINTSTIETLNQKAIEKYFSSRTQTTKLQRKLVNAARIGKLQYDLSADLRAGKQGDQTAEALKIFQQKYGLKQTGQLNKETLERIESVAACQVAPIKKLKVPRTERLMKVRNPIRLNMQKSKVADLQRALAWSGYNIDVREAGKQTYGKSTRQAVIAFQTANQLPVSGNVGWKTAKKLNALIKGNSQMVSCKDKYRVRGTIRNDLWEGVKIATVQVFERKMRGDELLVSRKTLSNGFYDLQYLPPVNPLTGKPKESYQLLVKAFDPQGNLMQEKSFRVSGKVLWANFTAGDAKFKGDAEFQALEKKLTKVLGAATPISEIEESDHYRDISYLRKETGVAAESIMKMTLASRIAALVKNDFLTPEVFYAFIRQNQPQNIPGDLMPECPGEWTGWLATLVERAIDGIATLSKDLQEEILKNALTQNLVSRRAAKALPQILAALDQMKADQTLKMTLFGGDASLKTLLSASKIPEDIHGKIASCLHQANGFNQDFWKSLSGISGVDAAAASDLRTTADLGYVTSNFGNLLTFLKNNIAGQVSPSLQKTAGQKTPSLQKIADCATLSTTDWISLIDQSGGAIPAWVQGQNTEQKKQAYAVSLKMNAESLFPAVAFIADVGRSKEHALGAVGNILKAVVAKPDFNFKKDNLEKFFATSGVSLGANEKAATKALQRIHRVAPDAALGTTILEAGYYSAAQVCREGRDAFINAMGKKNVSVKNAVAVYENCRQQYAVVLATLGKYRTDLQMMNPDCVLSEAFTAAEIVELKKDIPDIDTLFGPVDIREVRHCESVLGPSAYLTDLFRFLSEKYSKVSGKKVKDILFQRRPDLGNIKLNCRNTDTPLPYIDLVCEILENRVVGGNGALNFQSTWPAEDLLAEPEHVQSKAYEDLKAADFPLYAHLNLWQEETRAFFSHLGVPRYQFLDAFLIDTAPDVADNNHCNSAAEYFGISDQEQKIILTTRATQQWQNKYWSDDAITASSSVSVSIFLQKSGLTYAQLFDLLQCTFVNGQSPRSSILCPIDNCDLDVQQVNHLSVARLDRMNRFLRLWAKTGMEMWELDLLITAPALGNKSLNNAFLIRLRRFEELRKSLRLSVEELAALMDPINTRPRAVASSSAQQPRNLFEKLFLSGSVDAQIYADFSQLLTHTKTTKNLEPYRAYILSTLALSEDDYNKLLPLTDGKLTQESLSILFRYKTLAEKLKVKIQDFILLCSLAGGTNPFDSLDTVKAIAEKRQLIAETGATLTQLTYLLTYAPDSATGWRNEVYVQKIQGLREALASLRDKIAACEEAGEDSLAMLLGMLSSFADAAKLKRMMDIMAGLWSATPAEVSDFITAQLKDVIPNLPQAINTLKYAAPVTPAQAANRRAYLEAELLNYHNATTIKEYIAVAFTLESSQADVLLNQMHLPGATATLLTVVQDKKLHARDSENKYLYEISSANLPDIFSAMQLLHKASLATQIFKCTAEELAWFVSHPAVVDTLDFNALPVKAAQSAVSLNRFLNLHRFLKFKRLFPEPENASLFKALENVPGSAEAVNLALCKLTGWDSDEQKKLHYGALNYRLPDTYEWFYECWRQKKIVGADFVTLLDLAKPDPIVDQDQAKARKARELAQAKYAREQWLKILKPIMDNLREKKRKALTAYLIELSQREKDPEITVGGKKAPNPEYWTSANDLYGWFLIDVEMCSDQLTSRIKQATLSTQLYVQRCFLNLENREVEVALPDPDLANSWNQWKWMKNYRVWEANRKVFLFPENWIEPELRDTKSPFFEELESDILSSEATNDNVEAALQRYIQKLEEVAHLEVCSVFHEKDTGTDLLHVVARTRSTPAVFYYRAYDINYTRWSPWEKIENDIQSDHVVPWVYNRKLHLFWLIFQQKPIKLKKLPPVKQDTVTQNPEPAKYLEIELVWSVRSHEGWEAKKIGKKKLIHPWERPTFSYNLKPRYRSEDNSLSLDLYISTSREFNENTFYDQFKHDQVRLTKVFFDENLRPWHSSSFIFDGKVKEVLLRNIPGYYFNREWGEETILGSYQYVNENFGEEGAAIACMSTVAEQLTLPAGMHYTYTRLTNNRGNLRGGSWISTANNDRLNVFGSDKKTKTLLRGADTPFEAVLCQQGLTPVGGKIRPVLYQDKVRSFFITQNKKDAFANYHVPTEKVFGIYPFYHPFSEVFQQEINRGGVETFYRRNLQTDPQSFSGKPPFSFAALYLPEAGVDVSAVEAETLDFTRSGAYSIYNWELFFHAPLMIACRLSQNQRFEEAMQWFHYIFDPTNTQMGATPQRFWVTKPFYDTTNEDYRIERIKNIIENIDDFKAQLIEWKNHPFKPHLIAEQRTVAYQRTVVMKYLDNLIAWGDQLFRQDTMESINEATLLYILANELLGRRPVLVPALNREEKTFNELIADGHLDTFGNARVEVLLENTLGLPIEYTEPAFASDEDPPVLEMSYYGLPHNDKLLQYWDTVEDRLFKIRHGLNIEGLKRQLALFEPPIDPALLVKAAAAGLDLAAVLSDMNSPAQAYRFQTLSAKAVDFCHDVKGLGDQLLKALERKDAEELEVLRSSNEVTILESMRSIKKLQIDEIEYSLRAIDCRKEASQIRIDHIKSLSEQLDAEKKAGDWSTAADVFKTLSKISSVGAMIASLFPDVKTGANGVGGSPEATVKIGGSQFKSAFEYAGKGFDAAAELCKWRQDSLNSEAAGERTKAERTAQISQIEKEIADLDYRKSAREVLKEIAEKDLENFEQEVEIRRGEYEYLRDRYTAAQLYQWMITQISTVYFQAYQLAYDMAKRAEKSWRRELGIVDSNFIQFGYWDSLKKGLLAADRLNFDIRRMEAAYLEKNRRELEITKHVSLARLAPDKLLELSTTGRCTLHLEEWMYNLDYPNHYRRRIKAVSVSVPCEADEFTNINCRLTLNASEVRMNNVVGSGYAKEEDDSRFVAQSGSGESIATSYGEYDNGLFELKFDDDRFLPFEGAGAISSWDIEMPRTNNQFDFSTMTDFVLHIHYTAQEGGEALGTAATTQLEAILPEKGMLLVGLKQCFPAAWEDFYHPEAGAVQKFSFTLLKEHYPFLARSRNMKLTHVGLVVSGVHSGAYIARLNLPGQADIECTLTKDASLNNVHHKPDVFSGTAAATGDFTLMIRRDTAGASDFSSLPENDLDDVIFVLNYSK